MTQLPTSKKFKIYKEVRRDLINRYPLTFPAKGARPPLKIGILRDIIDDDKCLLPAGKIRIFLSIWTRSTAYLKSVSGNNSRVDLSGVAIAEMSSSHSEEAKNIIKSRRKKRLRRLTS